MEIQDSGLRPLEELIPTWSDELLGKMLCGSFTAEWAAELADIQPVLVAEARRRCQRPDRRPAARR